MKYLFIGGSNDGRRIDVYRLMPYVQLYVRRKHVVCEPPEQVETETYKAMPFRGKSCEFWIYVLDGMTADSLIQRLIDAYPDPAAPVKSEPTIRLQYG